MHKLNVFPEVIGNDIVYGDSWEMAFIMLLCGYNGTFSGNIKAISDEYIMFGKVGGIATKKQGDNNTYTYEDIAGVSIPRY